VKYLLGFLVMLLVAWRWRTARAAKQLDAQRQRQHQHPPTQTQVEMVRCGQCGVHVPANEAVYGARGTYCSNAHRQLKES